jgi:hypothetical protein
MAYSVMAKALRRCRATRKDGEPCQAYAVWDDPRGLCASHGRRHTGPMPRRRAQTRKTSYPPCECPAYQWPHRPGGGLCRWPDVPEYRLLTPAGTKSTFNGETWRFFSLGKRLNDQRAEKRVRESLRRTAETEEIEAALPVPPPEPKLSCEEEITLVLKRIGMRPGGR